MTLKELSEHPEQASEEDLKALREAFETIKEFGKRSEYILNGITMESGRSQEELAIERGTGTCFTNNRSQQ